MLWQLLWVFLWSLLLIIPGIVKCYAYSMQFFLLSDNPQLSVRESLNISQKLTHGFKWELFNMSLSFAGWILLSALSMGIGYLWLLPYWQASFSSVYCFLKEDALKNGRVTKAELGIVETPVVLLGDEWDNEIIQPIEEEQNDDTVYQTEDEKDTAAFFDYDLARQAAIIAKTSLNSNKGASKI